ncbi:MAG: phosphoribosylamine--glycine ligase [Myxococcota bacterium]
MRLLLVGGGGREHALAWALARHGHSLAFTHGNPGFERLGTHVGGDPLAHAEGMDLVVIGPEAPLAAGLVDQLTARGIPAFGPTAAAARLETSKIFTKTFAQRHHLPTAGARVLSPGEPFRAEQAWVVKLDGLAAGKGVWVCADAAETDAAVAQARAARPDADLLLEELLVGPEVSVLGLSDGERVVPLLPARDHKRRFDGDRGPNTGGMGAVAPVPVSDADLAVCHDVLRRAVAGMAAEGAPFRGVLYGGFMLTPAGPRLLEFNVRFGDPECQPLVTMLDEDLAPWLLGSATGRLPGEAIRWKPGAACCVVVSADTYPEKGADADIEALPADAEDLVVFHAGTARVDGRLRATGGRVLGVVGRGPDLAAARARAYRGVAEVRFSGAAWRSDIGATA